MSLHSSRHVFARTWQSASWGPSGDLHFCLFCQAVLLQTLSRHREELSSDFIGHLLLWGQDHLFSKELLLFHSLLLLCRWEGWEKEQVARPFRDKKRPAVDNGGFLPPELLCRKDQERQVQTKALTTLLLASWCLNQHLCKRMNELEHKLLQQLQSL